LPAFLNSHTRKSHVNFFPFCDWVPTKP
jgi:hypothetical protein